VDARPSAIDIDTGSMAVIVVDMQNDFGSKGGMFDRAGIDISGIRAAIQPTAAVVAAARRAKIPIVYLKMGYMPDLSDLGAVDSPNRVRHLEIMKVGQPVPTPNGGQGRILIRDTWGTQIVDDLTPHPGDLALYKTRFSGFYRTGLDAHLRRMGVRHLLITGCTTSVCVESTIRDATFRDYLPILLSDCTAEPIGNELARSNHEASLLVIEALFGWVSSSRAFLDAV
jgi:ureidoacrylate peracid hydrolase